MTVHHFTNHQNCLNISTCTIHAYSTCKYTHTTSFYPTFFAVSDFRADAFEDNKCVILFNAWVGFVLNRFAEILCYDVSSCICISLTPSL